MSGSAGSAAPMNRLAPSLPPPPPGAIALDGLPSSVAAAAGCCLCAPASVEPAVPAIGWRAVGAACLVVVGLHGWAMPAALTVEPVLAAVAACRAVAGLVDETRGSRWPVRRDCPERRAVAGDEAAMRRERGRRHDLAV